jgi:Uma2 family endonuclease
MSPVSSAALISVEEYFRITEKPYREYRDGAISIKSWPDWNHSIMQSETTTRLRAHGVESLFELTCVLSPTKYLIPDVIAAMHIQDPYPTEPVLLCCEILSPDQETLEAMLAKCEEYHAWGVPFCWVLDPVKRAAWEYPSAGEPARATAELRAGEIAISLEELFAVLTSAPQ